MKAINQPSWRHGAFLLTAAAFFLIPWLWAPSRNYAPGIAVIAGVLFAVTIGNPFAAVTGKLTSTLLGISIVGMGFGMNLVDVLHAGANGMLYTFLGIAFGIGFGVWLGRKLGLPRDCMYLVSVGTSICGGSAIAAAAPVLKAKAHDVAIASATVFTLNAVALVVFPIVGHALHMDEVQFGFWSALGIHDTSSVVGATMQYGPTALEVGTTVKLARALWIVPVTLFLSCCVATAAEGEKRRIKVKIPWFIPGFLAAAALVTWLPATAGAGAHLKELSKYLMILTLFLIGANLTRDKLKELGLKPVIHGVVLWIILAAAWGAAIHFGWVHCVK
ncbi:YeiH family protein [Victivallis sp. Marseille-Q1083]|uniref:YeiH family protein n=1 Tax=Victivallis sp. Marseille-Q1083 TaxID=2717288 RepID=UPI0015898EF2|nr:putative sulfate exporter family transporter [Victivallis sp. Marseille-Q1083]